MNRTHAVLSALAAALASAPQHALADNWPMRQRDMQNTGRANFNVPASRLNATFFDSLRWQKRSPNSPGEGNISTSTMVFFDGVGPAGEDVAISGYHWPKGVQAMDRQTGRLLWFGNPRGGESIGASTCAFSNDGATVYVLNDATSSQEWPSGHPLMAFSTVIGPSTYWHNGANADPNEISLRSPTIAPDGRVFAHGWNNRPAGAADTGASLQHVWLASTWNCTNQSDPALDVSSGSLRVVVSGTCDRIQSFNGSNGALLWQRTGFQPTDANPTIDPVDGRIFVPLGLGNGSVWVAGLSREGVNLWATPSRLLYQHIPGSNNPERVVSTGCLSHDGSTYYFQTVSQQGTGKLYAVRTSNGTLKWTYNTQAKGWTVDQSSSPIVTSNGVVIVGNDEGGVYYAIHDTGSPVVLDTFTVAAGARAASSATIASNGLLYLPARTTWLASNGDGETPDASTHNLFSAFDLNHAAPPAPLPPPSNLAALARNASVALTWTPFGPGTSGFSHYAVYRSSAPFNSIAAMTPLSVIANPAQGSFTDTTAVNGQSYWYAITTVTTGGGEFQSPIDIGPRTPFNETDLQIVSIARSPRFPRYDVQYTGYTITEPSGFGPYFMTAATGLGSGQSAATPRWPALGQQVSYTATIRNRGSNTWTGSLPVRWLVDNVQQSSSSLPLSLQPDDVVSVVFTIAWDGSGHDIRCEISPGDARPQNDTRAINSKSVPFLSYVDRSRIEEFREETTGYPDAVTDDFFDWLNHHMDRFNAMFDAAGAQKRVHFDILESLPDAAPEPPLDRSPFAIFPLRYRAGEPSLRTAGYYRPLDDIDYGLLHEMGHQLGLIDLYRLDLPAQANLATGLPYTAGDCLMRGVSDFLSEHSAQAMNHWLDTAHGYFGQYIYAMPTELRMRFLANNGAPLENATVRMYQKIERPGVGEIIPNEIKFEGVTDSSGEIVLPNVPINSATVPQTFAGDELRPNPFGYLAVIGANGLLHFKIDHEGFTDHAWLDVTEANNAFWRGQTASATFDRHTTLGGVIQLVPPDDMTEENAASWTTWASGANASAVDDFVRVRVGRSSMRFETDGGFDTLMRYPGDRLARWNLSNATFIRLWMLAENNNLGFQDRSPWLRFRSGEARIDIRPTFDVLNQAIGQWVEFIIPLAGDAMWQRTDFGSPDLANINSVEIHADTWGYGFKLWIDGVGFDIASCPGDANGDRAVDFLDLNIILSSFGSCAGEPPFLSGGDLNGDKCVDFLDLNIVLSHFGQSC